MTCDSIDKDAELIGIKKETWRKFKQMYVQDDLPYFQKQDDHEAFVRHKEAMAKRAFAWYRKCKDPNKKMKLIDIYNGCATMKGRE